MKVRLLRFEGVASSPSFFAGSRKASPRVVEGRNAVKGSKDWKTEEERAEKGTRTREAADFYA